MTVSMSLFWAIMLVVSIHTILHHLINWGWRSINPNDENLAVGMFVGTIIEILVFGIIIYNITI